MNSSGNRARQTLAIETFLCELANLGVGLPQWRRFYKRYQSYFPADYLQNSEMARFVAEERGVQSEADREISSLMGLHSLARQLRKAWDQADSRAREWELFELRRDYHASTNPNWKSEIPQLSPFEEAIVYFQRHADRARHCLNPDCNASPYFIAEKRRMKYCSPECAKPAQKLFKREWWNKYGAEWRKQRSKKSETRKVKHGTR